MPCTWLAVREAMWAITSAVKVLHGDFFDPSPGQAVLVAELLVDDRPAAHIAQLGAEEGVAAGVLALLKLDHDPELPLPLDRHPVAEIAGVHHVRQGIVPRGGVFPSPACGGGSGWGPQLGWRRASICEKIALRSCCGRGTMLSTSALSRPADSSSMSPNPQVRPQIPWNVVRSWIRSMAIDRENLEMMPSFKMIRWSVSTYSWARQPQ